MAKKYQCSGVQFWLGMFDEDLIKKLHKDGIRCNLFYADNADDYKKYLQTVRRNDAQLKVDIERKINELPYNMLQRNNDASDIIVSLTTHGKRLAESAPYGIYSLFTQTVLPNRIVLNVNKDNEILVETNLNTYVCDKLIVATGFVNKTLPNTNETFTN